MRLSEAIQQVSSRQDLSREAARELMLTLLSGAVPEDQIVAFLAALRDKGETVDELTGFAEVMRAKVGEALSEAGVDLRALAANGDLVDTCGTGGDGKGTFNVSTAAALVAAAAGARVAKHGNRSISSRCGSADVLEALGVRIELPLPRIPECLETAGMVFLFAPQLHVAIKHVMPARRRLRTKTVFNLLGPLTNPLHARVQLAGVYDPQRTETIARVLAAVGTRRAFVVTSDDGMDEISLSTPTRLAEAANGQVETRTVSPDDFGLKHYPDDGVAGGDAAANARIIMSILKGEPGAQRDIVVANAAAALVVADLARTFVEGAEMARKAIDSGAARRTLSSLADFTRRAAR